MIGLLIFATPMMIVLWVCIAFLIREVVLGTRMFERHGRIQRENERRRRESLHAFTDAMFQVRASGRLHGPWTHGTIITVGNVGGPSAEYTFDAYACRFVRTRNFEDRLPRSAPGQKNDQRAVDPEGPFR